MSASGVAVNLNSSDALGLGNLGSEISCALNPNCNTNKSTALLQGRDLSWLYNPQASNTSRNFLSIAIIPLALIALAAILLLAYFYFSTTNE